MIDSDYIQENVPVKLTFSQYIKEIIHNFFRRPTVVSICTHLPAFLFKTNKELATLINKCRQAFGDCSFHEVKVYGGDKLKTLKKLEQNLKLKKVSKRFNTVLKFSSSNSLDAAREMRDELKTDARIGILNLANRRQPGGVGLAPYGGSQEEYLVRRSNLAYGLDPRFKSEKVHEQLRQVRLSEGYADVPFEHHIPYFGAVVSKDVTFIDRIAQDKFDVISAAAPDMRKGSDEYEKMKEFEIRSDGVQNKLIKHKIKAILDAAIAENIENLVLGAFGCGCFQNDTREVAQIFSEVLKSEKYRGKFNRITFAITDQAKLDVFSRVLSPKTKES